MTRTIDITRCRLSQIVLLAAFAMMAGGCATQGTSGGGVYGDVLYYDDPWYWGGCCIDPPSELGPPRPEHPIATPPPRPEHPIATPPATPAARPTPMPRAAGRGGRR